jgi:aryl-alcohol dehydrogenase-like predicted oxidoreductase
MSTTSSLSDATPARPVSQSGTFTMGDVTVHRLGFGAMRLTGPGCWGPPSDRAGALRVLRRAVDLGVDFIDTADSYGPYVSEELIAEALHPYPRSMIIATKAGLVRTGPVTGLVPELRRAAEFVPVGRPEYLRQQCEMSLRRLRLERIDVYFLHRIDPKVPAADQFGLLGDLQREGKIRHVGLSEVTIAEIEAAQAIVKVAVVQNLYNMGDRNSDAVVDFCGERGIGFVPWFPLGAGRLLRSDGPIAQVARQLGATSAQVVLAWLLRRSMAMLPIPGTASLAHLDENCRAASVELDDVQFAELSA